MMIEQNRALPSNKHEFSITKRLWQCVRGDLLTPRMYVIKGEPISWSRLNEGMKEDALFSGDRMMNDIPNTLAGYHLELAAYDRLLMHKDRYTSQFSMVILGDKQTKNIRLHQNQFICWLNLGMKKLKLTYVVTGRPNIAMLAQVNPMHHFMDNLYEQGNALKSSKIERLQLDKKGFPRIVDWAKTLQMYSSQTKPDANGNFSNQSEPLTAEDIYRQTLLPAK